MTRPAPTWLAELQRRFGEALRTPLDRATGTLRAEVGAYDAALVAEIQDAANASARARLAVYNRQYWFRLFGVMQSAFPLTSRLLGLWEFNGVASRFVLANPPAGWDVDAVADGFAEFFARAYARHDLLVEAAWIDAAFRDVFRAPRTSPFRPSASDAAALPESRLVLSPGLRIVRQSAPLLLLRRRILAETPDRVELPAPSASPEHWAILSGVEGTRELPLEPREAELVLALGEVPVREALARIERTCPNEERAALPAKVQGWLARATGRGFFVGMSAGGGE